MFYIYLIFNLINGKIYVGQTTDPNNRWKKHLYVASHPTNSKPKLIHRAISKYGSNNFEFRIIQKLKSSKEASEAEMYWIDFYQSNRCRYPNGFGYNLTDGGESTIGTKWSDESKENFSKLTLGENNNASILTTEQVIYITTLINQNISCAEISKQYNVSKKTINDIRLGKRWSHLTKSIIDFNQLTHGNLGRSATGKATINATQVKDIKVLIASGMSLSDISKQFNVSYKIIYDIKTNKSWKHIT